MNSMLIKSFNLVKAEKEKGCAEKMEVAFDLNREFRR